MIQPLQISLRMENVLTKKTYEHALHKQNKKLSILTYHEILERIQLYEPLFNQNKILIQLKMDSVWQYWTTNFSIHLKKMGSSLIEVRYRPFYKKSDLSELQEQLQQMLDNCSKKLKEYQSKFQTNLLDINILWASPLFFKSHNEKQNRLTWSISYQYIKAIYSAIKRSKKRVFSTINFFNYQSLAQRDHYEIVYLICHSQSKFPCLVGENSDGKGEKLEISPSKMQQIFKGKSIELLIIHSSYPYNHLDKIKSCEGIKNVLLIKSNPIYNSDSVYCFFQKFFRFILTGETIKKSLSQAIKQVEAQFQEDKVCCCYHNHDQNCQLNSQLRIKNSKYHLGHYLKHKREQEKRQNFCCCPEKTDLESHKIGKKFQFQKSQNLEKQFFFQSGEPQGDIQYLEAFEAKQLLIGSNDILKGLLKDYVRSKFFRRGYYYSYSEIKIKTHDTKYFFINIYCNFLIRRKVFKKFRIYKFKDLQHLSLEKNKDILHVVICYSQDLQFIGKLKQFRVNLLVVKQFREETDEKKHIIEPFTQKQSKDYICAQKHLSQQLKQKVSRFFQWVWKDLKHKYIYYPSNFDYEQIMRDISSSNYHAENQEYFKWIDELIRNKKLLDYLIFIIIYSFLPFAKRQTVLLNLKEFQFYKILHILCPNLNKFLQFSEKYYSLVFQKYFLELDYQNIIINLVYAFAVFTEVKEKNAECALYEATNDSNISLFIFVKDLKKIKGLLNFSDKSLLSFIEKVDLHDILTAGLTTINKIISSFYLFNILGKINENEKQIDVINSMLFVVSHAIIYRKRYQQIIRYDENCWVEEEQIGELSKRNSQENFLKKDERMDLSIQTIQYKQINPKIYNQNDFKGKTFPLSRKFLLQLIGKFLSKRNFKKSLAISHSLKLQLLLQIVYQNGKQNEQFPHETFRSSLAYLEKIALDPKINNRERQRIFFHIYMSQIALQTRGGRSTIVQQQLSSITNIGSQVQFERTERDYNQISLQLLKIIHYIAPIQTLKSRLWRFISYQTKRANQFRFLEKYEETVAFWNSFNTLIENMKKSQERQDVYLRLFQLKGKVGELTKNQSLSVYVKRMCLDLEEAINEELKNLSKRTLILLVSKDDRQKFYINYPNIVKKALDQRQDSQLLVIKMNMCKQNIAILQGGFCQYLLITSNLRESLSRNNNNNERKIKTKKTLEQLLKLEPRYIFYCLSKDFEDIESIYYESKRQKTGLVYYDFRNVKAKLDESLKQACAIVLSIKCLQQKVFQNVERPEKTLVFHYGKQISESQNFVIKEQEIKKIEFGLAQINKTFSSTQLKPKNSHLSSYDSIDESESENMRQVEKRKVINFDFKDLIIQGFLEQVKLLKKLPIVENYTVKTHTQKNIQVPLNLDTYIGMVKTYFSQHFEECKFFEFSDDCEDQKNIYLSQNSKIISFFTSNQFLQAYRSNSNLCIIIKNFKFNRKLGWVSQIIKEVLFELPSTKEEEKYKNMFESRFIKINDVPCLISLKKNISQ